MACEVLPVDSAKESDEKPYFADYLGSASSIKANMYEGGFYSAIMEKLCNVYATIEAQKGNEERQVAMVKEINELFEELIPKSKGGRRKPKTRKSKRKSRITRRK